MSILGMLLIGHSGTDPLCPNLEIQEGACTFAPQTLKTIERLSAESVQQKQGFRENDSTFARVKD